MSYDLIFYKDDWLGQFEGDLIDAVAHLFPPAMATRIRQFNPIQIKWQVYERITWEGRRGHRFYAAQSAVDALKVICDAIYDERHKTPGYPGYYTTNTTEEGLPTVCILPCYFVIWQAEKVSVPQRPQ